MLSPPFSQLVFSRRLWKRAACWYLTLTLPQRPREKIPPPPLPSPPIVDTQLNIRTGKVESLQWWWTRFPSLSHTPMKLVANNIYHHVIIDRGRVKVFLVMFLFSYFTDFCFRFQHRKLVASAGDRFPINSSTGAELYIVRLLLFDQLVFFIDRHHHLRHIFSFFLLSIFILRDFFKNAIWNCCCGSLDIAKGEQKTDWGARRNRSSILRPGSFRDVGCHRRRNRWLTDSSVKWNFNEARIRAHSTPDYHSVSVSFPVYQKMRETDRRWMPMKEAMSAICQLTNVLDYAIEVR